MTLYNKSNIILDKVRKNQCYLKTGLFQKIVKALFFYLSSMSISDRKGVNKVKVTIRFRENKDQHLINWIKSLEEGSRSRVIRNILKANTRKAN